MNKKTLLLFSSLFIWGCGQMDLPIDNPDVADATLAQNTIAEDITWDSCNECLLPSGVIRALPWNIQTETTIPDDIRTDVKASDGWVILDSTVDIIGYLEKKTVLLLELIIYYCIIQRVEF